MEIIGCRLIGKGKRNVLLLHNWFGDATGYDPLLPYLDLETSTYLLADLRGYGRSKEFKGEYSLREACQDVINLVDSLSWDRFHIVGHSMSGMIAQKIAVDNPSRVITVVAVTPVPASGSPKSPELMHFLEQAALDNEGNAVECLHRLTGRRLSSFAVEKMVRDWKACSKSEARIGYLHMFSDNDFSGSAKGLEIPVVVIYGEFDVEGGEAEVSIRNTFFSLYPNARMECCQGAGHFPNEETPVYLASRIEHFIGSGAS